MTSGLEHNSCINKTRQRFHIYPLEYQAHFTSELLNNLLMKEEIRISLTDETMQNMKIAIKYLISTVSTVSQYGLAGHQVSHFDII